jgi:hypothetical protein
MIPSRLCTGLSTVAGTIDPHKVTVPRVWPFATPKSNVHAFDKGLKRKFTDSYKICAPA